MKFGISLVGPWKVLEENKTMRPMLGLFLIHTCVATWAMGIPVPYYAMNLRAGCVSPASMAQDPTRGWAGRL